MKILENHEEQITVRTYYIMMDNTRHVWYKEFMNPEGTKVLDVDIVDEDNYSIILELDDDDVQRIESMVDAFNEHGEFAYQDKF
jgi:hypothetical protein